MTTQRTLTTEALTRLRGHEVIGSDGQKLGKVEEIYVDGGRPEWVSVKAGLFGSKHSFVPLQEMTIEDDSLRVAYAKNIVADSPRAETNKDGILTTDEEERLYAYYGEHGYSAVPREATSPSRQEARPPGTADRAPVGESDDAMTRSEEETVTDEEVEADVRKERLEEQDDVKSRRTG